MSGVSAVAFFLSIVLGASAKPQGAAKPAITALAVTPDGKSFIQGSQLGVRLRPLSGDQSTPIATKLDHVHALAFSPDGKLLAIAGGSPAEKGAVELWTWPECKLVGRLDGHADVVYDVVWLDGGKRLATASADRSVCIWDSASRKSLDTLTGHSGPVLSLAVSPDGAWLCSGSADQTIRVWDTADRKLVRALVNHLGPVHHLAFRPAQAKDQPPYLASASGDGTVRIWQPSIGRMVRIVRHPESVIAVGWSADGSRLYSGGKDGVLRLIDGDSDKVLYEEKHAVPLTSLAIRATASTVLVGNARGEVHLAGK